MNDELIPWNITVLVGGELDFPAEIPLPEQIKELLRAKVAEHPELHGGDYVVRCERWGQGWFTDSHVAYGWRAIYVGEPHED